MSFITALVATSQQASAIPTTDWRDYTAIGLDHVEIGPQINFSGNFAAINQGGSIDVQNNAFQLDDDPPPFIAADTIDLAAFASIVDAYSNDVNGPATSEVRGSIFPQTFPLPIALPSLPAAVFDNCTLTFPNVTVGAGDVLTLNPGCYGDLTIFQNGTLFLNPGNYRFRSWDIRKFSDVISQGAVSINIRTKITTEEGNVLGPNTGNIDDFQVWIGSVGSPIPRTSIGPFSMLVGTFFAPNDDEVSFRKGVVLIGTVVGGQVFIRGQHEDRPPTPTPTATRTPTPTPSRTPTPTPSRTPTPTPSRTPTPTPSRTPTPTPSRTPTPTPSRTPTPTPSRTPTPTPSRTPTPTPSRTPTPTPFVTPTVTATPFRTPTPTPTQPIVVPTPTPTPRRTPTPTPVRTPTPTPFRTPTPTPFRTPTPTPFRTPTPTPSVLPTPTPTSPVNPPTPTPGIRKKPWGKMPGIIQPDIPPRQGGVPSMKRKLSAARPR